VKPSRWQPVERGPEDSRASSGHTAPSWHTFTRRVWERGTRQGSHRLVLRNLTNDWSYRVHRKIAEYEVRIYEGGRSLVYRETGFNWQALVRKAKQWSYDQEGV